MKKILILVLVTVLTCSCLNAVCETNETEMPQTAAEDVDSSAEQSALRSAEDYLDVTAFSYEGLVGQLEYEGYSHIEAVYAADHCGADWYEQARLSAEAYLDRMSFSHDEMVEQLVLEGFTEQEAEFGAEYAIN